MPWIVFWFLVSVCIFYYMFCQDTEKRKDTLVSMCDEMARMLQDQFTVSMNHIQAMSILISTLHHARNPSAIDQVLIKLYLFYFANKIAGLELLEQDTEFLFIY